MSEKPERTPLETIAFAAWVNCPPDAIPPEYRQHTCEATMIAWRRVVTALMSPAALAASPEVAKLIREAEAGVLDRLADKMVQRHKDYMTSKGRNPADYTSAFSQLAMFLAAEAAALRGKGE